jgi:hypothetical protein
VHDREGLSPTATGSFPDVALARTRWVGRERADGLTWRLAVYAALAALVLAPVLAVRVPAMGDTLNHLARMHVLAAIGRSAELRRYYEVSWTPIPYLAMDAVVPLLARVMPIYLAGKLFVAACVLMPPACALCLHGAVHRRLSLVPAAAFLLSYNSLLSFGFLNFLFSAGLAVMLFAAWVRTAHWPRWPRAAIFAPFVLLLYFGHAFACAAYCLAVAGCEIARAGRAGFRPARRVAADWAAALAQAAPAMAFAATLDVGAGYVGPLNTQYGDLGAKLTALASPMLFLHDPVQGLTILGAVGLAAASAFRLRLAPDIWPAALAVGLAALAVPHVFDSTWGTDLRLPLVALLLLIGGAGLRPAGRAWRAGLLAGLAALVAARSADAWIVLRRLDGQIAETRQVLAGLPRGARLLVVNCLDGNTGREQVPASSYWHMPLTAVIDHDAFLPTLFSGLTTVRVRDAYRLASTPNGLPVTPAQLRDGAGRADPPGSLSGNGLGARYYHYGWPAKFDFVLVQRFGCDPGPLPSVLVPVAQAPEMDLYRVRR